MNYSQLDRKASALITRVQNRLDSRGAYENAGQKELRQFCDLVDTSNLGFGETVQLKQMMCLSVDNLRYS